MDFICSQFRVAFKLVSFFINITEISLKLIPQTISSELILRDTVASDTANYRPQTKSRKGNVFTSVCQEFCPQEGGVYPSMHWASSPQAETPTPRQTLPGLTPPPLGRHPPGQTSHLGRHPPGQTPPWADTPPWPLQQMVRILLECILV